MKRPFAIENIGFRRWQVTEKATKKVLGVYSSRDAAGNLVRKLQKADALREAVKCVLDNVPLSESSREELSALRFANRDPVDEQH